MGQTLSLGICEGIAGPLLSMFPLLSYRVKSEAVVARREPREEVEDVSSYLCTELVYFTINLWAWVWVGKGVGWISWGLSVLLGPLHLSCVTSEPGALFATSSLWLCGVTATVLEGPTVE